MDDVSGAPTVMLVCEHASHRIPDFLGDMGLGPEALHSHIAWDPGALAVARLIAKRLSAPLVHGGVSRLVYDCNRPPKANSAMPSRSEAYDIPANISITPDQRQSRVDSIYKPFCASLEGLIDRHRGSLELMVTIHSFTPVYHGKRRAVELGILHGQDAHFAKAMIAGKTADVPYVTMLNEPYSAADGVAHTLDARAVPNGLLNVMIEIRNDLIRTSEQQVAISDCLVPWISQTLARFEAEARQ